MPSVRKYTVRKPRSNRIALDDKKRLNAQLYALAVDRFFHGMKDSKDESFRKLSKAEERQLIMSLTPDREQIEHELIKHNIFLAINIASKNAWRYKEYDTLISNAMFGLVEAAQKFDIERGTKFSTYASQWIRREILYPFFNDVYDKNITKKSAIFFDTKGFGNAHDGKNDGYSAFRCQVEPSVEFCYADIKNPLDTISAVEVLSEKSRMIDTITDSISSSPLTAIDKDVYSLLFLDGKTLKEVAEQLAITTNAVSRSKGRIARFVFEKFGNSYVDSSP